MARPTKTSRWQIAYRRSGFGNWRMLVIAPRCPQLAFISWTIFFQPPAYLKALLLAASNTFKYQPGIQRGVEVLQMHYYPEAMWRANDLGAQQQQEQLDSRNQLPWNESGFSSQYSQSSNVAQSDWKPGVQPRRRKTTTILAVLLTFMTMVAISLGVVLGMYMFHAFRYVRIQVSVPLI